MTINENEQKVLDRLGEYGDLPTGMAEDLTGSDFTINQVKGYLSSLVKKELIIDCELPNGLIAWQKL